MALERQRCANHPDRYGHAVCMSCRKTVCQECATDWDGIYYCSPCLAVRRRGAAGGAALPALLLVLAVSAALFLAGPTLLVWAATLLQRM